MVATFSGILLYLAESAADPGFARGTPTPKCGAPTYYSAKISRRLHVNKENWTEVVGSRPQFYYVDPPLRVYQELKAFVENNGNSTAVGFLRLIAVLELRMHAHFKC